MKRLQEGELEQFLGSNDPYNLDALDLPVSLAGSSEWDTMDPGRRGRILGGMLRNLVGRAKQTVPLYREDERWQEVREGDIQNASDLFSLPVISKDTVPGTGSPEQQGILGFRERVLTNPNLLVPENIAELIARQEAQNPDNRKIIMHYEGKNMLEFSSGGSQGKGTLTCLSYLTLEMEAYALARALSLNGFQHGESIACFYTDTHKGGLLLRRAAELMDMPFHSKTEIFAEILQNPSYREDILAFQGHCAREDFETAERYAPTVREGIGNYIQNHKIKIIESVQPPPHLATRNAKGGALAFMTIFNEDPSAFRSLRRVFLTGFPVPKEAYETLRQNGLAVSTTWGSTEVMALATYDKTKPDVNALRETPFPTLGCIAWYQEKELPHPRLLGTPLGLEGMLLVTGLIGAGSTFINYRIGDKGIRTESGYRAIERSEMSGDIAGSCAADALAI